MKTTWVIGLDLSVRHPAACAIPTTWGGDVEKVITLAHDGGEIDGDEDPLARMRRYHGNAEAIVGFLQRFAIARLYVEQYAFSKGSQAHAASLRENAAIIKYRVFRKMKLPVEDITASTARKTLLNNCPRSGAKDFVVKNVRRMQGKPRMWTEDETDAFVIANHGMRLLGLPVLNFDGV